MSPDAPASSPRVLRERRAQIIDILCDSYAQDDLSVEEFEERLDRAHRSTSADVLDELVADLQGSSSSEALERRPAAPPVSASTDRPKHRSVVAILSGSDRKGTWRPAENNTSISILGGVKLDFREAELPPGVTTVRAFSVLGSCEIIVPPGLRVDCSGTAVLGDFDFRDRAAGSSDDAPVLRVAGLALLGDVTIHTRLPGETARQAKKRLKREKKEARRLARREQRRLSP